MNGQFPNEPGKTFLDRSTIIALVVVGVVWFGWSKWVAEKYPQTPVAATETASTNPAAAASTDPSALAATTLPNTAKAEAGASAPAAPIVAPVAAPETLLDISTDQWTTKLSSLGMGFTGIDVVQFKTRDKKPILVGTAPGGLFATKLFGTTTPIAFNVTKTGDNTWVGVANFGAYKVEKTAELIREGDAANRAMKVTTVVTGDLSQFPGLSFAISDEIKPPASASFLAPSYDHHDWFVRHEDTKSRVVIAPDKPEAVAHKNVFSVALSSHYFTAAIADRSALRPDFHALPVSKTGEVFHALGTLDYKPVSKSNEFRVEQAIYVGPKDVDALRAADPELERVIDYGMFAVIGEKLLWFLRLSHSWLGNWGLAIILLTIVVRAIVLPFNVWSFKSMKVMQKLQPQIQQVRERYKDDPRRMNEEVMRLMKENKANPIGGCLPMLLQLPVFFALYQVLAMSIELYRQPFYGWITDLTVKDPYYVLPVLMGVAMFMQQKITPVADPQQAKILQWMPVIFAGLMITLPSGLTLYIFVSTLFGIAQQYALMRDKSSAQPTKTVREAKA